MSSRSSSLTPPAPCGTAAAKRTPSCFRLAVGGYGLFGVVYSVTLRLAPRQKLRRAVTVIDIEELMPAFEQRIEDGFLYGDYQYSIDDSSANFLTRGVFSCYQPVATEYAYSRGPEGADG